MLVDRVLERRHAKVATARLAGACLLVVATSTSSRHRRWGVRALIPAGTDVVLDLALAGLWDRFVLPRNDPGPQPPAPR